MSGSLPPLQVEYTRVCPSGFNAPYCPYEEKMQALMVRSVNEYHFKYGTFKDPEYLINAEQPIRTCLRNMLDSGSLTFDECGITIDFITMIQEEGNLTEAEKTEIHQAFLKIFKDDCTMQGYEWDSNVNKRYNLTCLPLALTYEDRKEVSVPVQAGSGNFTQPPAKSYAELNELVNPSAEVAVKIRQLTRDSKMELAYIIGDTPERKNHNSLLDLCAAGARHTGEDVHDR